MEKRTKIEIPVVAYTTREVTIYCCDKCGKELNPNNKWGLHFKEDYKCDICNGSIYCFDCMKSFEYDMGIKWVCPVCQEKYYMKLLQYSDKINRIAVLGDERDTLGKQIFGGK